MGSLAAIPLSGTSPQVKDPIQTLGQLMAIKGEQQRQQLGNVALQQQQMALESQKAIQQAFMQANGDLDKTLNYAAQSGKVLPQALFQLKQMGLAQRKMLGEINETQLANQKNQSDLANGLLQGWHKLPQDQQVQQWPTVRDQLRQMSPDHAQMIPDQPPDDNWYGMASTMLLGGKNALDMELKRRQVVAQEETAEAREIEAKTAQLRLSGQMPGGALRSPELQAQDAYISAHPGSTPLDYQRYIRTLPINTRYQLEANGGLGAGGGGMTTQQQAQQLGMNPVAFDQAAEKYFQTGQLPPMGRGMTGPRLQRLIANRVAELHPDEQLAPNSAAFKANEDSLKNLVKQRDQVISFENTAQKNLDIFLDQAKKVVDAGSPLVNRPLRAVKLAAGDPNVAAYDAARRVAINEIAKVTSNPGLSGQLSDEARREVETFNPSSATLAQTYRVAQILKQDMANRHNSYDEQIAEIKGRLGNYGSSNQPQQGAGQGGQQGGGGKPKTGDFFSQFGGQARQ